MALPELFSNPPTPGGSVPWQLTTLNGAIATAPAAGTQETWNLVAAPPAALATSGQFRFVVDNEILLDVTGGGGTARQVLRGQEGSTPATHANGAPIYHILTAGALGAFVQSNSSPTFGTVNASGYQVAGTPLAASHLSNGVTGTGSVMLSASPVMSGTMTGGSYTQTGGQLTVGSQGLTVSGGGAAITGNVVVNPTTGAVGITVNDNGAACVLGNTNTDSHTFRAAVSTAQTTYTHAGFFSDYSPAVSTQGNGFHFKGTANGVNKAYITVGGTLGLANTTITNLSDQIMKGDIRSLDGSLAKIDALKLRQWVWNDHPGSEHLQGESGFGFVAQEAEEVFPHLVSDFILNDEGDTVKGFGYNGLIPFLVGAIQELSAKVAKLEGANV